MQGDRVWVVEDPDELLFSRKKSKRGPQAPPQPQKNPALAFSFSLLVWGTGQIYNKQVKLGFLFALLMANFYLDIALVWFYWPLLKPFIAPYFTSSRLFTVAGAFYFLGLLFWFFNALQAYYRANKGRTVPFQGVKGRRLSPACSLLIPGWGQFLNGQAKKGTLFLTVAIIGFVAVPALLLIPFFWPHLRNEGDRFFWESILAAALLFSPLFFVTWLLSGFDAWKVALDETKKAPLLKRFEYANNRRRMRGWGETLAEFKSVMLVGLSLLFCLTLSYYYFPKQFYLVRLQNLRIESSRREMVLIPRLIDRLTHDVFRQG